MCWWARGGAGSTASSVVRVPLDCAAGLTTDLRPRVQRLDGVQAWHFVQYRNLLRGDIDRIDNVKTLAMALVARVRELHIASVSRLPELPQTYYEEVETNAGLLHLGRQQVERFQGVPAGTGIEVLLGGDALVQLEL